MSKKEKAVIKEVLEAMDMHYAIIRNNVKGGEIISKETMRDMEIGLGISIDKLERLIK